MWTFLDYIELTGRNPIRQWLDQLPWEDQAKIDGRLLQMRSMARWPEKWISKYQGTELFEFRISGHRVEYRPLGIYFGKMTYVLLAGAIEKGDKIPKQDIETAIHRLSNLRRNEFHVTAHDFGDEGDLEKDEPEGVS